MGRCPIRKLTNNPRACKFLFRELDKSSMTLIFWIQKINPDSLFFQGSLSFLRIGSGVGKHKGRKPCHDADKLVSVANAALPMTPLIQSLPTEVVHQIAAGEVIDSLAAVVRELVENALDAQATRLTISLWPEQGRVRVADDGLGMTWEDLQQAALPHSTSKIRTPQDLWCIHSLGFRGQALHSLSQVAVLEVCSRPQGDPQATGWRVTYSPQGEPLTTETVAIAPGTIVTVANLFADWPTRRQGLPALNRQLQAVQGVVQQLALCHPQVYFQGELRDEPWFALIPGETARQRLPQILKTVAEADLREVTWPVPGDSPAALVETPPEEPPPPPPCLGSLYVLVGLPDRCHRRRADWIKIAVNGRPVQLPELEQVVLLGLRRTLPRDRYPVCFLHLQTSPQYIDWHRHPDKSTLYLHFGDRWRQAILQAITEVLRLNADSLVYASSYQQVKPLLKAAAGQYGAGPLRDAAAIAPPHRPTEIPARPGIPVLQVIAQVQNRYILAEHAGGICLIEQHIAHERVLYERLCQQWTVVPLETPVMLENLSETQVDTLQGMQIDIAPFGHQLWIVRNAPASLAERADLADALLELSRSQDFDAALVATACRTAIRNGTPLPLTTLEALVRDWSQTRHPHTCPHGRPICLSLEESHLARFFKRHWVIGKSHGLE